MGKSSTRIVTLGGDNRAIVRDVATGREIVSLAGVGDMRESPALKIIKLLGERGADIRYHDDFVPQLDEFGLSTVSLEDGLTDADAVVIVTAHPGLDVERIVREAPLVVDFRGVTRGIKAPNLLRL